MVQIERSKIFWGEVDKISARGVYKRIDSGATELTRGVQRGWKWQNNTDRRRRAIEDNNNDGNKADKLQIEVAENGGR